MLADAGSIPAASTNSADAARPGGVNLNSTQRFPDAATAPPGVSHPGTSVTVQDAEGTERPREDLSSHPRIALTTVRNWHML